MLDVLEQRIIIHVRWVSHSHSHSCTHPALSLYAYLALWCVSVCIVKVRIFRSYCTLDRHLRGEKLLCCSLFFSLFLSHYVPLCVVYRPPASLRTSLPATHWLSTSWLIGKKQLREKGNTKVMTIHSKSQKKPPHPCHDLRKRFLLGFN